MELLISSDIAKYCEFKSITRVLTQLDGQLQQVGIIFTFFHVIIFKPKIPEQYDKMVHHRMYITVISPCETLEV